MENSIEETISEQSIEKATNPQQGRSKHLVHLRFLKPSFWSIFSIVIVFTSLLPLFYEIVSSMQVSENFLFRSESFIFAILFIILSGLLFFINRIYNKFGLIQALVVSGIIILGLIIFGLYVYNASYNASYNGILITAFYNVFTHNTESILIGFSMSSLFIIIGLALYILYLCINADKNKKMYWGKFIIRGIATIIIIFLIIISFATWLISSCEQTHCFPHP